MHSCYKKEKKKVYDIEWKIEFLWFVFKVKSYPPQGLGLPSPST